MSHRASRNEFLEVPLITGWITDMNKNVTMKKTVLLALSIPLVQILFAQGVGINETGGDPHPSAILDASSSEKGFLPPRLSSVERDAIAGPAKGLMIYNTDLDCVQYNKGTSDHPNWICTDGTNGCGTYAVTFNYKGSLVQYGTVQGAAGNCWLDRNLGATRVAMTFDDTESRGDLFQFGRGDDGHQNRTSGSVTTQSSSLTPGSSFIRSHLNWYIGSNPDALWQGQYAINNPCPPGWRLPTHTEWNAEAINNRQDAFDSPLKLPVGGFRSQSDANIYFGSSQGYYWTGTIDGSSARRLQFTDTGSALSPVARAHGMTVRCIKN